MLLETESVDKDLFTLKIFYGGQLMLRHGSLRYVGGGIEYIDNLRRDCLCFYDLKSIAHLVGYKAEAALEYYYRKQLDGGVALYFPLSCDEDVLTMTYETDRPK